MDDIKQAIKYFERQKECIGGQGYARIHNYNLAIEALKLLEQNEVLADTVNMLSPLMMENHELKRANKEMKNYIRNGVELGYIDDREGDYKKYI